MVPLFGVAQMSGQAAKSLILSNTVIGFLAGIALLLLVIFARHAATADRRIRQAWAWVFATLGGTLFVFGFHTTVTWPLLGAGNLIFGEPSVIFGVILLAAAGIIHQTPLEGAEDQTTETTLRSFNPFIVQGVEDIPEELLVALQPLAFVSAFTGLMLILLAIGGAALGEIVFRPPPNEYPTGMIAGTGIESIYFIVTYGVLGTGTILLPIALHNRSWLRPVAYLFVLAGILLLLITYVSFLGHISLSAGVPPGGIPWPPK